MKVTPAIDQIGYGLSGDIGGLPKNTYYTPDGRVIRAIAAMREYVVKDKDGKVIGTGTRDANLDKGWLLTPPKELKPHCKTCDRWHDTLEEVEQCAQKQAEFIARVTRQAKDEQVDEVASLKSQVAELKALVSKLIGGKDGALLQSKNNGAEAIAEKPRS